MTPFRIFVLLFLVFTTSTQAQDAIKKPGFLFDLSVGSSTRLGKKNPDLAVQSYTEKLRTGISYEGSLYFRVKPETNHFVGFKYNSFHKKAGIRGSYDPYGGNPTDNVSLGFYGLGYMYNKTDNDDKNEWLVEGAVGYMTYKDKVTIGKNNYEITGNSFGFSVGAAYYIKLYKALHVGPKLSMFVGSANKLEVANLPEINQIDPEIAESLTRFDAAASLRLKF